MGNDHNGVRDGVIGDVDTDELVVEGALAPTPEQHERLKSGLHGTLLQRIRRADRRYLVIGRGGGEKGDRRTDVRDVLSGRNGALAYRLEDFGFTGEEIDLWAPAFDVLAEMSSIIVGVLEDFDGGHVWELGYLYHHQTSVRDVLWLLKRVYASDTEMRERYDNGMAASHIRALEEAVEERVIEWDDPEDLRVAVEGIP